jgi:hypothetical protein
MGANEVLSSGFELKALRWAVLGAIAERRKRLINLELRAHEEAQGIGGAVPSASSAAERILAEQAKMNVAAVELEKKRLEKMKLKQQKEIEQVN